MPVTCDVPVAKFRDYIFQPGATHGKGRVFASLGYSRLHSQTLADLYAVQAAVKYAAGEYVLGRRDQYGQRITLVIDLPGIDEASGKINRLLTGWMLLADGGIHLNTPFTGFAP